MRELKLNPDDFKVLFAGTIPSSQEDWICVEVAPGYKCDMFMSYDDPEYGPYALPGQCSDGIGYIHRAFSRAKTDAVVSDEDIWAVEDFAEDYYDAHPEKFDSEI